MVNILDTSVDVQDHYLADESTLVEKFVGRIALTPADRSRVNATAIRLIDQIRSHPGFNQGLDAFMAEYNLASKEGIRLMSLAEALARIPDDDTRQALITSKLSGADWARHLGSSASPLVNTSTRALLFSSSLLETDDLPFLSRLIARLGEPVIRHAIERAVALISDHFVLAERLEDAESRVRDQGGKYRFSFDMLGEAAVTMNDARRYRDAYRQAIRFAGHHDAAAVSIKLSALHPRFEAGQQCRVASELYPALAELVAEARDLGVRVTIDAEEASRLELTLALIKQLLIDGPVGESLGVAVQAYSRRAMPALEVLRSLATHHGQPLSIRLVKGAYWDSEIKRAQMMGLNDYPVFTRKAHTDISYLACAHYLIFDQSELHPQFATHNVQTVANLLHWTEGQASSFEFQRLHGMGTQLYDILLDQYPDLPCTIYAPIGPQQGLLPYLIRRLLENSANTSFVNQLAGGCSAQLLARHPVEVASQPESVLGTPPNLYPERQNSEGLDSAYSAHRRAIETGLGPWREQAWHFGDQQIVRSPVDGSPVGQYNLPENSNLELATERARRAWRHWSKLGPEKRGQHLRGWAAKIEQHRFELLGLLIREAGKTIDNGLAELREAVDFCRYYAVQAEHTCQSTTLPGPAGESNQLHWHSRGTFACISPWNFPAAIFTGQVAAALAAGNVAIAKPAPQTPLTALRIMELGIAAGLPADTLQVLPGSDAIGAQLIAHEAIDGVAFTGSALTARRINRQIAERDGALIPLIAETGGQNAMVVDSSALPEQVVKDVLASAFSSAGQRCSALRVLYLQQECAESILDMLCGAMQELCLGDPGLFETDIGPVIDDSALKHLSAHADRLSAQREPIGQTPVPNALPSGYFFAPRCFEIDSIRQLKDEHFGPILHVVRYDRHDVDRVIDEINSTGYGLTFGIHSRDERFIDKLSARIAAGNIYVNRNMIGAVVGTQPFGGLGLSGTGPKAGGPNYLHRYMQERTLTDNLAAIGGAVDLINRQ